MQYTFGGCKVPGVVRRGTSVNPHAFARGSLEVIEHLELTSCRAALQQQFRGRL